MTDDSPDATASKPSSVSSSGAAPESVEETLGRMRQTLQRINVEGPGTAEPGADAPEATDDGKGSAESSKGDGLARLVLTLVQLLHDLLERQAIRRMENETLTPDEVERIGQALMKQAEEIRRICEAFGIDPDNLDIDLGTVHVDDPA